MRGVIIHAAKDLRIDEIAEPALTPTEVRVRVAAGGICGRRPEAADRRQPQPRHIRDLTQGAAQRIQRSTRRAGQV